MMAMAKLNSYCNALTCNLDEQTRKRKLKASRLLNVLLRIHPLTFLNEAFCLSGSPFVASTASP